MMVSIIGATAVVLGAFVAGYLYLKSNHSKGPQVLTPAQQKDLDVQYDQMTTDLKDGSGLIQFAVTFQASDMDTKTELVDLQPAIQDLLNRTMRQFTSDELKTVAGYSKLQTQIQIDVNHMLPKGKVTKVYFTDQLVQ